MSNGNLELSKYSPVDQAAQAPLDYYGQKAGDYRTYGRGTDDDSVNVRRLWRAIRKRIWLIILLTFIVTAIATIVMYRTDPIYKTSAMIEVDEHNTLMKSDSLHSDPQNFSVNINTKKLMLQSRPVLEDAIVSLNLHEQPSFLTERKSILDNFKITPDKPRTQNQDSVPLAAETAPAAAASAPPPPLQRASARKAQKASVEPADKTLDPFVAILKDNLAVEQIRDTRVLEVSFTHADPTIAAAVPNAIIENFIHRDFQNKTERFTNTAAWLDRATQELRSKVKQAEEALASYIRTHNIFSTNDGKGGGTLTTEKLGGLHAQVMRAETDRSLKQSLYEEVKAGRIAQLPDAFTDPKILDLQKERNTLSTSEAQLSAKFGPEHPRLKEIKQQLNAVQQQIDAGQRSLAEKLTADYRRSLRDEQSLKGALVQAKNEAVNENQDSIQYNLLKQDVDTANALYTNFVEKTNQANVQVAEQYNNVRVIEAAQVPTDPTGPKRLLVILSALFLSLASSIGLALFLENFDNTVKSFNDVKRYVQLPVLGVIPVMTGRIPRFLSFIRRSRPKVIIGNGSTKESTLISRKFKSNQLVPTGNRSVAAEAYRGLRTSLLLSPAGGPPKTILVTSGQSGEGKTTTVINTAISLAQLQKSVLIIDCDLRKPTIHEMFDINPVCGLATYLSEDVKIEDLIHKLSVPNLSLLPCGAIPPDPAELISSGKMKDLLSLLSESYDHIVIDSPPLLYVADSTILSTMVDGVVLVVRGGESAREDVAYSREALLSVGAKIYGVVLNGSEARPQYSYAHGRMGGRVRGSEALT